MAGLEKQAGSTRLPEAITPRRVIATTQPGSPCSFLEAGPFMAGRTRTARVTLRSPITVPSSLSPLAPEHLRRRPRHVNVVVRLGPLQLQIAAGQVGEQLAARAAG